jgi:hypothetical protein
MCVSGEDRPNLPLIDNMKAISLRSGFPVKNVLFAIAFGILHGSLANSEIDDSTPPPLNKEGMVGEWEAISELPLPTFLLHFEFRLYEPSFLVTKFVGSPGSQMFKLVSSDINEGHAKFHFRPVLPSQEQGGDIQDLWLEGVAHGSGNVSVFRAKMWKNAGSPPKKAEDILFVKGAWTRDIAAASKEAEEVIKEQARKSPRD